MAFVTWDGRVSDSPPIPITPASDSSSDDRLDDATRRALLEGCLKADSECIVNAWILAPQSLDKWAEAMTDAGLTFPGRRGLGRADGQAIGPLSGSAVNALVEHGFHQVTVVSRAGAVMLESFGEAEAYEVPFLEFEPGEHNSEVCPSSGLFYMRRPN